MHVTAAAPRVDKPTYAQAQQARQAVAQAAEARGRAIDAGASKALDSPRLKASESAKQQSRAKVQSLVDRLKILKKLFAGNPKEMAKALAQLMKELRTAVKAFKAAGGDEMKLSGEVARAAVGPETPAPPQAEEAQPETRPAAEVDPGRGLYDAVVDRTRDAIGRDGLDFIKLVRSFTDAVTDVLNKSRGDAMIRRPTKETEQPFKDADDEVETLRKELDDMERDIRHDVPAVGMTLSIAA